MQQRGGFRPVHRFGDAGRLAQRFPSQSTDGGDDGSRERALAAGATRFMTKPFAPEELLGTVNELLAGTPAT